VGVMALRDDKPHIVEYSEIDDKTAKAVDPTSGRLTFGSGNICNHFYTLDFIREKAVPALSASYHIAHKKIPHADASTGETVKPTTNNGIKLELFIFDVFPLAKVRA
jgi:UDP-N-acetylglucosamine/UDP-N-acetylgalactosamine diphosphorylase